MHIHVNLLMFYEKKIAVNNIMTISNISFYHLFLLMKACPVAQTVTSWS